MSGRARVSGESEEEATSLPSPAARPRMAMTELCDVAMLSRPTVTRRIAAGKLPKPVDRGREQLFDRAAVYRALGITTEASNHEPEENPWERGARVFAERQASALHNRRSAKG